MAGVPAAAVAGQQYHEHTAELREGIRETDSSGRRAERARAADDRRVAKHNKKADRQQKKMEKQVKKMERHAQRQMEAEEAAARAADRLVVAKEVLEVNKEAAAAAEVGQHSNLRGRSEAGGGGVERGESWRIATGITRDDKVHAAVAGGHDSASETTPTSNVAGNLPTTASLLSHGEQDPSFIAPAAEGRGERAILPPGHAGAPGVLPVPGGEAVTPGLAEGRMGGAVGTVTRQPEVPAGLTGSELERPAGLHPSFEESSSGRGGLLQPQQHLQGSEVAADNMAVEDDSPRRRKGLLGTLKHAFTRPKEGMQAGVASLTRL
jgi:hypothetical protein